MRLLRPLFLAAALSTAAAPASANLGEVATAPTRTYTVPKLFIPAGDSVIDLCDYAESNTLGAGFQRSYSQISAKILATKAKSWSQQELKQFFNQLQINGKIDPSLSFEDVDIEKLKSEYAIRHAYAEVKKAIGPVLDAPVITHGLIRDYCAG